MRQNPRSSEANTLQCADAGSQIEAFSDNKEQILLDVLQKKLHYDGEGDSVTNVSRHCGE